MPILLAPESSSEASTALPCSDRPPLLSAREHRTSRETGAHQNDDDVDEYAGQLIKHKARQLVGKAGLTQSDVDDIAQEMWLDLIRRMPRFNPKRAQRRTFIARVIEHKTATILRHRRAAMRDCRLCCSLNQSVSQDTTSDRSAGVDQQAHGLRTGCSLRSFEEEAGLATDLEHILSRIPPDLRALCKRLKSESLAAIAREMGVPRTTLQESVRKIRRRFEDGGLRNYL